MSKFDAKKVMPRYRAISFGLIFFAVLVVGKSLYIMTAKRDYWMKVASRQKKDSVTVKPNRGNILSCTGQLLASSLPEFKVFMDFVALSEAKETPYGTSRKIPSAMDFIKYFQTRVLQSLRLTWKKEKPRRRGIG